MAKSFFQQKAYQEAIDVAEGAPEPRSTDLLTILGLSNLRAGNTARADGADEVFRDLRARNPVPAVSLAQWHSTIGERDAALSLLTRADGAVITPTPVSVDPLVDGIR